MPDPLPPVTEALSTEAELRQVLHRSTLPLATVSLVDLTILDANHAALCALGYDDASISGRHLGDVLDAQDEKTARIEMGLLADGAILAYEARRKLQHADGHTIAAHVWVRSLHHVQPNTGLIVFIEESGSPDTFGVELPATRLRLSGPVVVGSIDLDMRVVRISAESSDLVGDEPAALIGHPLVERIHRDDVAAFLLGLGRAIADGMASAMHVRFRHADGSYVGLRIVVTPTRGGTTGPRLGIVMTEESAEPGSDARVADLERHLWRIALEVQSAGVVDGLQRLPDPSEIPGLEDLSTRQWEIVTRLLRGERVPDIATATFVSQSTVRNQLATIYRKLGVHSQTELLALLRGSERQTV